MIKIEERKNCKGKKEPGFWYGEVHYESKQEIWFMWYLEELCYHGFIAEYKYQPAAYLLGLKQQYEIEKVTIKKTVIKNRSLLREHSYQADFEIVWSKEAKGIFYNNLDEKVNLNKAFIAKEDVSIIEVKPEFDINNMTRLFSINQKWVYSLFFVYVQAVQCVPYIIGGKIIRHRKAIFNATFAPDRYRLTDKGLKGRKKAEMFKRIQEFIN